MTKELRLSEALMILNALGLPRQQLNERTALCLLCLLNLTPDKSWAEAEAPLVGITPIMDWSRTHYEKAYAPNTRETFRRQSMHQFIQAGVCLYNPDNPGRPVNSPNAVYQIEPNLLRILKAYGSSSFKVFLKEYFETRKSLAEQYANEREMMKVPVKLKDGFDIRLSAGEHSELIKCIVEDFGPRYVPDGELVYVGDTGDKHGYFDKDLLKGLGVVLDGHGKLPDVVIYDGKRNWLILIESVTSHGPVDSLRHKNLENLFSTCTAGLVYVSAFPNKKTFLRYLEVISWETEVWVADAPTHMIHFNGTRFLGPYK